MESRKRNKTIEHSVDGIFTFALISIFAILALLIVVIGTKVYKDIVETSQINNEVRSSLSYVSNKVRSNDGEGTITIDTKDGMDVLRIGHEYDGEPYETIIYFYEGAIYEYFGTSIMDFSPSYGEKIIEVSDFSMRGEKGILYFKITDEIGKDYEIHVAIRT